ncbi:MAG: type III-B CRISPR module RAMP protein Cmr1 [Gammaproteobacteria bacterium]|nr:MAG: type III-B CRISPR module RAMP protein Cmr1 [Gammaproteobacteria bacterium]
MAAEFPPVPAGASHHLQADFVVVTPMFIGDGQQHAESVRPPSLKGALRFWWRALQWPRFLLEAGDPVRALSRLHAEEAALFGLAAGHDTQAGQSRICLRIVAQDVEQDTSAARSAPGYLMGMGLQERSAIRAGGRFTLALTARDGKRGLTDQQWRGVREALLAFGLLGGLGSRARRGLGSVSLRSLIGGECEVPEDRSGYAHTLRRMTEGLPVASAGLPPFTAFSLATRIDISLHAESPEVVLQQLDRQLQLYRGWGYHGRINGERAEQNFPGDHDDMLKVAGGGGARRVPERAVFGLPHNYRFSSGDKAEVESVLQGGRRASPLMMHVHQLASGECLGVQCLLPAQFLPPGAETVSFKGKPRGGKPVSSKLECESVDWQVIHRFLDRFPHRESLLAPSVRVDDGVRQ